MKNLNLYFIYVTVRLEDTCKKYTFVTLNSTKIKNALNSEFKNTIFPEISVNVTCEEKHTVSPIKEEQFYTLCINKLSNIDYIKYQNHIPFEVDINQKSFKSEILLENSIYPAKTELEIFLKKHDILQSYYNNNINFKIKALTREYSRQLGEKKFEKVYDSHKIDINILLGKNINMHDSHIYTSSTEQILMSMTGINDSGKKFFIDMSQSMKMKDKEAFQFL